MSDDPWERYQAEKLREEQASRAAVVLSKRADLSQQQEIVVVKDVKDKSDLLWIMTVTKVDLTQYDSSQSVRIVLIDPSGKIDPESCPVLEGNLSLSQGGGSFHIGDTIAREKDRGRGTLLVEGLKDLALQWQVHKISGRAMPVPDTPEEQKRLNCFWKRRGFHVGDQSPHPSISLSL